MARPHIEFVQAQALDWNTGVLPGAAGELVWTVKDGNVSPRGIVHLLVPAKNFWDDVGFT